MRDRHLEKIESLMADYFTHYKTSYDRNLNSEMALYQLKTGGKRLRALLPAMVFDHFNAHTASAYPLGVAAELIHNATLVHDDLQDGDRFRRGNPTVWNQFGKHHAINSGDTLFQHALFWLLKLDCSHEKKLQIIENSLKTTIEIIEGQSQEFLMKEEWNPSIERYLEVARSKTSALFKFIIESCLIFLDKTRAPGDKVSESVSDIGVLYQITDDLIDIYGNKGRGRSASDIAEGKISALVACSYTVANANDRETLKAILLKSRNETDADDINRVVLIFEKYRAKNLCEELMRSFRSKIPADSVLINEILRFLDLAEGHFETL